MARPRQTPHFLTRNPIADRVRERLAESSTEQPLYARIAIALADEMTSGRLSSGQRLPSQRQLAEMLGVNLTTISRCMTVLKDRGFILPEVGRGTAVRGRALDHLAPTYDRERMVPAIDLSVVNVESPRYASFVRETLAALSREDQGLKLTEYHPALGDSLIRATGANWLKELGVPARPEDVAVTAGAQNALVVVLSSTSRPGDVVLVPRLVYQGVKAAARLLGLGLVPIEIDEHGLIPESVEEAASRSRARALFVVPTIDNPTGITLPLERRHAITNLAKRFSLAIIEDDIFRPLSQQTIAPFAALYPEGTFHISSLSKILGPGCRCGFLSFPSGFRSAIASGLRSTVWMADRLSQVLSHRLIQSGAHQEMICETRSQLSRRHDIALGILGTSMIPSEATSNLIWVKLDEARDWSNIYTALHDAGVGVAVSSIFAVGRDTPITGFRIYKSSARSIEDWTTALKTIAREISADGT